MKRTLISTLLLILFVGTSYAYDFRKVNWGMTKAEVLKSETSKPALKKEDMILYDDKVIGKDVVVIYVFAKGILVRARYALTETHTNKNDYLNDYEDLKNVLTKKYGEAKSDNHYWRDELYQDDYSQWGFAVSLGHLAYFTSWENKDSEITLALYGENYEISCIVEYMSKKYENLEQEINDKKALNAF